MVEDAICQAQPRALQVSRCGTEPRHPVSRVSAGQRSQLAQHYNEFHALIVRTGVEYCRKAARCEGCPLKKHLPQVSQINADQNHSAANQRE
jgi:endonuclease III